MKKRTSFFVLFVGIAVLTAVPLFANGQSESKSATAASGPVNIRIWDIQTQEDQQMIETATQQFNQAHPNIQAKVEWFQNDTYKDKIRIALGAGNGPDILYNWGGGPLRSYVAANTVVDLTPYLNADPTWKNRFPASVWGPATVDGKIYGIPTQGSDAELLFYNKDMLKKYNLPVPTTWNELVQDAGTLVQNNVIPIALAGKSGWPEMIWVQYLTDRIGGPQVFNDIAAGKKDAWSNPAVIKALELCQQLVKANAFEPGYAGVEVDTNQDVALVASGKAAFLAQGDWAYSTFKNSFGEFFNAGKLGYTAIPAVDPQYANEVVGAPANYYSVAATSKNVKADIQYLSEVNLNDFEVSTMLNKLGRVPPVNGIESQLKSLKDGAFESWLYNTIAKAGDVQLYWDQYLSPTQAKIMLTNMSNVFLMQETPQDFAKAMNAAMSSNQ
ncbi:MAG TPA: extracellular solute-binding protein [Spirochaetia bacterium]|nr:extracellular solute-binding protein [Spirochaetia bacterium]